MTEQPSERPKGLPPAAPYNYAEQMIRPPAVSASEVAQETFEHVYEVDPRLMQRFVLQQMFPNWDTLRIMNSRYGHLAWMHAHFANLVVVGSELLAEIEAEEPRCNTLPEVTAGGGHPGARGNA